MQVLASAGKYQKRVPKGLLRAVRDGRVGLEVVTRFIIWYKRMPRSLRWLLQVCIVGLSSMSLLTYDSLLLIYDRPLFF